MVSRNSKTNRTQQLLLASFLGGAVLFAWNTISWHYLPFHRWSFHRFENENAVINVLRSSAPTAGMYELPHFNAIESMTEDQKKAYEAVYERKLRQGPVVIAAIRPGGTLPDDPSPLFVDALSKLFVAFLLTLTLLQTSSSLAFWQRVGFVTLVCLIGGILTRTFDWSVLGFSFTYTLIAFLDLTIGGVLSGMVIVKVLEKTELRP